MVSVTAHTQDLFCRYDAKIIEIYTHIKQYELQEAKKLITDLKGINSKNAALIHMENYMDCLSIFVSGDPQLYKAQKNLRKERVQSLQNLPANVPEYYYIQADIDLQWAAIRMLFGDYFSAFSEIRKAYKSLHQCVQIYPDFQPAHMRLAILEALIGTIPDGYQWGAKLIGLEGNLQSAINRLDHCIVVGKRTKAWYLQEALAIKSLLLYYILNDVDGAQFILQEPSLAELKGPMGVFLFATIYRKAGENALALKKLNTYTVSNKDGGFHYLNYMKGDSKLRQLDKTSQAELLNFVTFYTGQNYLKSAYQKLAWHGLIFQGESQYFHYMEKVIHFGSAKLEKDKSALQEAKRGVAPNPTLLKARLLFDGGYYDLALIEMNKLPYTKVTKETEKLEYIYRKGRIKEKLGREREALSDYQQVIDLGRNDPVYYACNAALFCGQIHEKRKEYVLAEQFYTTCLKIKPEEYRSGIHQKAKAGLQRIKQRYR